MATVTNEKGLTIGEAADKLGVLKKTLRHILARPDRRIRLLREYRDTKKGLTTIEIIPFDLFEELSASIVVVPALSEDGQSEKVRGATVATIEVVERDGESVDTEAVEEAEIACDDAESVTEGRVEDAVDEAAMPAQEEPLPPTEPRPIETITVAAQPYPPQQQASAADTMLVVATYERLLAEKESRIADMRSALENEREQIRRLTDALAREQEQRHLPQAAQAAPEVSPRKGFWARLLGA